MGSAILVQSSSEDFKYGLHVEFIANLERTQRNYGGWNKFGVLVDESTLDFYVVLQNLAG
jgi:hypothetical protein